MSIQGKLKDVKSAYSSDEYILEIDREEDAQMLIHAFTAMHQKESHVLSFREKEQPLFEVMRYLSDRSIPITKLERVEPTLESLFMEAPEK